MRSIHLPKGIVVGVAGAGFLLVAGWLLCSQLLFFYRAQRTSATVIGLHTSPGDTKRNAAVFPVLRFTTAQGQAVTATSSMGNYPSRYKTGQRVALWYHPARPESIKVVSLVDRLFEGVATVTLALIGGFLLLGAQHLRTNP